MTLVKDYLLNYGVNPINIPIAIGVFKIVTYTTWAVVTAVCIKWRPVSRFFRAGLPREGLEHIKVKIPNAWQRFEGIVNHTADKVSEWRVTQKFFGRMNVKQESFEETASYKARARRNLGLGVAEGVLMYKLIFPIWAPLYFYAIAQYYYKMNRTPREYKNNLNPLEHVRTTLSGDVVNPERLFDYEWIKDIVETY